MVADDKVEVALDGLLHHLGRHIQRDEDALQILVGIAKDEAGVVVVLLIAGKGFMIQVLNYFVNLHASLYFTDDTATRQRDMNLQRYTFFPCRRNYFSTKSNCPFFFYTFVT